MRLFIAVVTNHVTKCKNTCKETKYFYQFHDCHTHHPLSRGLTVHRYVIPLADSIANYQW